MPSTDNTTTPPGTEAAVLAHTYGYTPVPILSGRKAPDGSGWNRTRWESTEDVREAFDEAAERGAPGVGLLLGEPSGNLVDVDLDHPAALRLRDYLLPPTDMRTGRSSAALSHAWYVVTGDLDAMETRRYKLPDRSVTVELRWTGTQTVIPPTIHPSGEPYLWEGEPWARPRTIDGRRLSIQVALLALGAVLLDRWPGKGSRHEAYLALAGALLRHGDAVHPYWERNLPVLISALADATHDDDGAEVRVRTTMETTLDRLRSGREATGWTRLAEIIGLEHMEAARRMAREVESRSGFVIGERAEERSPSPVVDDMPDDASAPRVSTWGAVDLGPYLSGEITMPEPTVLRRTDGAGLLYPGRVNSLFGSSESAKTWIAMAACVQEMARGERVVYVDLEDEPTGVVTRMRALGASDEDMKNLLRYVHPDGPIAEMQRYAFGDRPTIHGEVASSAFQDLLSSFDPTMVVVDGMTVLYGLHGHDTNAATSTDVITSWLKTLTRRGRTCVLVIDHTGKTSGPGSSPIGAHHKVAMVQGTALRADAVDRPVPGGVGLVRLVIYKDRPGAVRKVSSTGSEQVAANVRIDSSEEDVTVVTLDPVAGSEVVVGSTPGQEESLAKAAERRDVMEQVHTMMVDDPSRRWTTTEVVDATGLGADVVRQAWRDLRDDGVVLIEGERRWTRYRLTGVSSDEDDDPEEEEQE